MELPDALSRQEKLIRRLASSLEKEDAPITIFETHISWILVGRRFAYKFKKAVHFDFLDFSTLAARHFYCQEELRLNRRLAPTLYLAVVAVTGSADFPSLDLDASGTPIEYAVKMRAFPQDALWSERLAAARISVAEIDALAEKMARFHRQAATAAADSAWGTPASLQSTASENLRPIAAWVRGAEEERWLGEIRSWHASRQRQLSGAFEARKAAGRVKECHGDLHCANILTLDGQVEVFDCIEFNPGLRWIDVINDIAFIQMDLRFHGRHDLAARLLNQYLEIGGDYDGLTVLGYYRLQRALVRCKVALLRAGQLRVDGADDSHRDEARRYLAFSAGCTRPAPVAIILMHGFSGSGKSTVAAHLVELLGAVRIRSDVERKRLHGLDASARAGALPGSGLYQPAATRDTYDRLLALSRRIVESGMPVVVDAAFLQSGPRQEFADLARRLDVPLHIVDVQASVPVMERRIVLRLQQGRDPSDAGLEVLAQQLAQHDPLSAAEMEHAIRVDGERGTDAEAVRKAVAVLVSTLCPGS